MGVDFLSFFLPSFPSSLDRLSQTRNPPALAAPVLGTNAMFTTRLLATLAATGSNRAVRAFALLEAPDVLLKGWNVGCNQRTGRRRLVQGRAVVGEAVLVGRAALAMHELGAVRVGAERRVAVAHGLDRGCRGGGARPVAAARGLPLAIQALRAKEVGRLARAALAVPSPARETNPNLAVALARSRRSAAGGKCERGAGPVSGARVDSTADTDTILFTSYAVAGETFCARGAHLAVVLLCKARVASAKVVRTAAVALLANVAIEAVTRSVGTEGGCREDALCNVV